MIDLYINLPSNNRYRRPANYMSKGYQTRRMAVDYQIPLVTNVKNAKILVEAIARQFDLEIGNVDYQTSHRTVILPGLVNVACFVPGLVSPGSKDLQKITEASIAAGFSMIRIMPVGVEGSITDARTLKIAQQNGKGHCHCDFNLSVTATSTNADQISHVEGEVGSLFIPFNHLSDNISRVATVTAHFDAWPAHKPLVTDARTTDLASILLLASLHNRRIHVTCVSTRDDIKLIALGKQKGLKVTCDVSIYSLYCRGASSQAASFCRPRTTSTRSGSTCGTIDVFSVGSLPYQLAHAKQQNFDVSVGIADALPLLLTSVAEGRLTLDDIKMRLYDNPMEIWSCTSRWTRPWRSRSTGRTTSAMTPRAGWSPTAGRVMKGAVQRVTFMDKVVCMDGELLAAPPLGKDMSSHLKMTPMSPPMKPTHGAIVQVGPESPRMAARTGRNLDVAFGATFPQQQQPQPLQQQHAQQQQQHLARSPVLSSSDLGPAAVVAAAGFTLFQQPALAGVSSSSSSSTSTISPPCRRCWRSQLVQERARALGGEVHAVGPAPAVHGGAGDAHRGAAGRGHVAASGPGALHAVLRAVDAHVGVVRRGHAAAGRAHGGGDGVASSVRKGETLQDTLRTLGSYGDAWCCGTADESSSDVARRYSQVPVVNAGNGADEHPTQAFLDLFTIREELGTLSGKTVTFVGDLLHGRTRALALPCCWATTRRAGAARAPGRLALPRRTVAARRAPASCSPSRRTSRRRWWRAPTCSTARASSARFPATRTTSARGGAIASTTARSATREVGMVVLHPLPRNDEVAEEVDFDQRAAYFRQVRVYSPFFSVTEQHILFFSPLSLPLSISSRSPRHTLSLSPFTAFLRSQGIFVGFSVPWRTLFETSGRRHRHH